jgi:NAD-dependent DNA ligase
MSWKKELKKGMWSDFKNWVRKIFTPKKRSELKKLFTAQRQVWNKAGNEMANMFKTYYELDMDPTKLAEWEQLGDKVFDEIWEEVQEDLRAEFIKEWKEAPEWESRARYEADAGDWMEE